MGNSRGAAATDQGEMNELMQAGREMLATAEGGRFQQAAWALIRQWTPEIYNDPLRAMKGLGRLAVELARDNPMQCLAIFLALCLVLADVYFNSGKCSKALFKALLDNWGTLSAGAGGVLAF